MVVLHRRCNQGLLGGEAWSVTASDVNAMFQRRVSSTSMTPRRKTQAAASTVVYLVLFILAATAVSSSCHFLHGTSNSSNQRFLYSTLNDCSVSSLPWQVGYFNINMLLGVVVRFNGCPGRSWSYYAPHYSDSVEDSEILHDQPTP